jgi:hypothetical protein
MSYNNSLTLINSSSKNKIEIVKSDKKEQPRAGDETTKKNASLVGKYYWESAVNFNEFLAAIGSVALSNFKRRLNKLH